MRNAEAPPGESQGPRFGLGTAFGASVVLHALLLILSLWFPAASPAHPTARPKPRDEVVQFTFAPPPSEIAKLTPQPKPPPGAPVPTPPKATASIVPPTAPKPKAGDQRPPGGRAADDPSRSAPKQAEGASDEGQTQNAIPPDPPDERGRPRPALDLGRAVRDFGDALDHAPRKTGRGAGTSTFVPDAGQFPTTGYGLGNLAFETRDFDWSDYGRQIYIAIWRAWHNRLYQTVDDFEKWAYGNGWFLNHENRIRFVIERSGQVTGIVVEADSGCEPLDASATQALAEVILPPLPDDFPKQREVVHARFLAEGSIRDMRPSLTRLKHYGLF
jgi:outer membrane biosynthesis protein TonB